MGEVNSTTNKPTENGGFKQKDFHEPFSLTLFINDNIIRRESFNVDDLFFDALECIELKQVMDDIHAKICADLEYKSRIYQYYTSNLPLKLTGFVTDFPDIEDTGITGERFALANAILSDRVDGKMTLPDGREINKTFYRPTTFEDKYGDYDRPAEGEVTLRLSLRFHNRTVYERIWDGNVYPRYVRSAIDLTNSDEAYRDQDPSKLNFTLSMNRRMTLDRPNVLQEAVDTLKDLLSGKWVNDDDGSLERYDLYTNNNKVRHTTALPIPTVKVNITGHTDIKPQDKNYFCSCYNRDYVEGWRQATAEKTKQYYRWLGTQQKRDGNKKDDR